MFKKTKEEMEAIRKKYGMKEPKKEEVKKEEEFTEQELPKDLAELKGKLDGFLDALREALPSAAERETRVREELSANGAHLRVSMKPAVNGASETELDIQGSHDALTYLLVVLLQKNPTLFPVFQRAVGFIDSAK